LPLDSAAISGVTVDDTIVVGGGGPTVAFDERDGRERWRASEALALLPIGTDAALGQPGGRVALVAARSGRVRWSVHVCPGKSNVTALALSGGGVIAGCAGGSVARIDRYDGRVTAESNAMHVDQIDAISPAGGCHLNLQAHQSGAILSEQDAVVDCRSLRAIMPQRQDVWFLGVAERRAVMADQCCGLGGAMEQPARIFTIDGATGAMSRERAFVPGEPFLAGSRVCVGQHSLVRCRALGASGEGAPAVTGLSDFPTLVEAGRIGISRITSGGATSELVDDTLGPFRPIWSGPATAPSFGYPDRSGSVPVRTALGSVVVSRDGRVADVPVGSLLVASNERFVFLRVTTNRLAGNRYIEELRAFPWH